MPYLFNYHQNTSNIAKAAILIYLSSPLVHYNNTHTGLLAITVDMHCATLCATMGIGAGVQQAAMRHAIYQFIVLLTINDIFVDFLIELHAILIATK